MCGEAVVAPPCPQVGQERRVLRKGGEAVRRKLDEAVVSGRLWEEEDDVRSRIWANARSCGRNMYMDWIFTVVFTRLLSEFTQFYYRRR
jgi:hypothetical protein